MTGQNLDHRMDMIWHDTPTQEPIAFNVEVQEGVLDRLRDSRISQVAFACTTVQHGGETFLPFRLTLLSRKCCQLPFAPIEELARQRIDKAERNRLDTPWLIEVRKVAAASPWSRPRSTPLVARSLRESRFQLGLLHCSSHVDPKDNTKRRCLSGA